MFFILACFIGTLHKAKVFVLIAFLLICYLVFPLALASPAYEDFTTYTEVDTANDRIQFNATHINHTSTRNEDTYLYKDFGADFFANFTHDLDCKSSFDTVGYVGYVWAMCDYVDDIKGLWDNSYIIIGLRFQKISPSPYRFLRLQEGLGGSIWNNDDSSTLSADTWYYVKIVKNGTSLFCGIYTTSALRNAGDGTDGDFDNLAITLDSDYTFRYLYACNTYNDGAGAMLGITQTRNFDLHTLFYSVIFYFNDGGEFRVNNETVTNGTSLLFSVNETIELASLPFNSSFVFANFNWTGGVSTSNPYNLNVTNFLIVWCYFSEVQYSPVSKFTFSPNNPNPNENVNFSGSASFDLDGNIAYYYWNFVNSLYWDILREEWDTLEGWTKTGSGTSEISPSGQLNQIPFIYSGHVSRSKTLPNGLPANFTVETKLKIDEFQETFVFKRYDFYNGQYYIDVTIYGSGLYVRNSTGEYSFFNLETTENIWYIWKFIVQNNIVSLYRNGSFIGNVGLQSSSLYDGYIRTYNDETAEEVIKSHEDYLKIGTGIIDFDIYEGENITHSFDGGIHHITLTVIDNDNFVDTFTQTLICSLQFDRTLLIGAILGFFIAFVIGLALAKH